MREFASHSANLLPRPKSASSSTIRWLLRRWRRLYHAALTTTADDEFSIDCCVFPSQRTIKRRIERRKLHVGDVARAGLSVTDGSLPRRRLTTWRESGLKSADIEGGF